MRALCSHHVITRSLLLLLFIVYIFIYIRSVYISVKSESSLVDTLTVHSPDVWNMKMLDLVKVSPEKMALLETYSSRNVVNLSLESKKQLCKRYGFKLLPAEAPFPRIFYGAMFSKEVDVLHMALYEMIDLLHSYTLVEANVTFSGEPRAIRFPSFIKRFVEHRSPGNMTLVDKIVYSIWSQEGKKEYYASSDSPLPGDKHYGREEAIRNSIGDVWRDLGMRHSDLAIVSDADEYISRDFLMALQVCDPFPMYRKHLIEPGMKQNRCRKTKLMSRSNTYSSYMDCPQQAKYHNQTKVYKGIRMYWHPDIIPASCLLDRDANTTVENLRTRPGSRRLMNKVVGWHYRNIMSPEDVLKKYRTYGHPSESPPMVRYNVTGGILGLEHIMMERKDDCSLRIQLLKETNSSWLEAPLILQRDEYIDMFRPLFLNISEYIEILNYNTRRLS